METSQFLADSRKRITGLLRQALALSKRNPELIEPVSHQINMELEIYQQIKQELIYPTLSQTSLDPALDYDRSIHQLLLPIRSRTFHPKQKLLSSLLNELSDQLDVAFNYEEHVIYPQLLQFPADRLQNRYAELLKQPKYKDTLPDKVQNFGGRELHRKSAA